MVMLMYVVTGANSDLKTLLSLFKHLFGNLEVSLINLTDCSIKSCISIPCLSFSSRKWNSPFHLLSSCWLGFLMHMSRKRSLHHIVFLSFQKVFVHSWGFFLSHSLCYISILPTTASDKNPPNWNVTGRLWITPSRPGTLGWLISILLSYNPHLSFFTVGFLWLETRSQRLFGHFIFREKQTEYVLKDLRYGKICQIKHMLWVQSNRKFLL